MTTPVTNVPFFPDHRIMPSQESSSETSQEQENEINEAKHEVGNTNSADKILMTIVPISIPNNILIPRSKSDIEISLRPVLAQIDKEKRNSLSCRKFAYSITPIFLQEAKQERVMTVFKCSAVALAITCLYPAVVGSAACLLGYRIENYEDLYSSNIPIATNASILFSNMGQGPTFLMQGYSLAILPSFALFKNVYKKTMCQILTVIYKKHISSLEREDEKAFLYEEANIELSRWSGYIAETDEIDLIMKKIEKEKGTRLSGRNILCMTARRFIGKAKKFPWRTLCKTSLVGVTALTLHPLAIGLMGCFESYRVASPNDLYSANPEVLGNAVSIYSNTGHIVEYGHAGLALLAGTATTLFDRNQVICETIKDIYDAYIENESLSGKTRDFLRERRRQELNMY